MREPFSNLKTEFLNCILGGAILGGGQNAPPKNPESEFSAQFSAAASCRNLGNCGYFEILIFTYVFFKTFPKIYVCVTGGFKSVPTNGFLFNSFIFKIL